MADTPLQPWQEQASSAEPVEAEAIRLARAQPPAESLSPEAGARIAAALSRLPPAPPVHGAVPRALPLIGVTLVGIGATLYFGLNRPTEPPPPLQAERTVLPAPPAEPPVRGAEEDPPTPAAPLVLEPPSPDPARAPPPAPVRKESAPENALLEESELLGKAVEQLRRQHDPKAALATLQRYFARYPRGELLGEAEVTRVDALLASRRRSAALKHLERLYSSGFDGLPRSEELALQRAELLADAKRDAEAARAFS